MTNIDKLPIDENMTIGIDNGIGSASIVALRHETFAAVHNRCFPVPETAEKKKLLNAIRRENRLSRRQTKRRRLRRNNLARLFPKYTSLTTNDVRSRDRHDPWEARTRGLTDLLKPLEFASALMHIAKRRGFLSNSKQAVSSNDPEGGKALKGMAEMKEKSQRYATIGEMLFKDAEFSEKKRNKPNDYSHTVERISTKAEVVALFKAQREQGAKFATQEFENAFLDEAFFQRPLQASEHLVGFCTFEPTEKRASTCAPSFERFRYLSKINTISILLDKDSERRLSDSEVRRAADLFGTKKSITYKHLRNAFGLADDVSFLGVPKKKPKNGSLWEGADVCRSTGCCLGTFILKKSLANHTGNLEWARLLADGKLLDQIAFTATFREEIRFSGHGEDESIERGLQNQNIPKNLIEPILRAVENGEFKNFKRAGHLSGKAVRAINPYLEAGFVYSQACEKAGYDHAAQVESRIEDIANPVVRQVLKETYRLFEAVVRKLGSRPGRVTIEMARAIGKPVDVRNDIARHNSEMTRRRNDLREQYSEIVGKEPTKDELLAFQLWKEQNHCCVYSGNTISPADLDMSRRKVEIDHILPRSRSQDNSYLNKCLCLTAMNQAKKNRSPYEWMTQQPHRHAFDWQEYSVWVESLRDMKGMKKRNLLMRNFAEREQQFVERNLNDTRYACKVFRSTLERLYRDDPVNPETGRRKRRVFTRPGPLTAIVRKSWGLESLKKDVDGARNGDLHHAVDAAIVATLGADEALTQDLTRIHQKLEGYGLARRIDGIPLPWEGFREDLKSALQGVFVSRPENRKGTGEGHEATIRRMVNSIDPDGRPQRTVFERKSIEKVTKKDLEKLHPVRQRDLIEAVSSWIDDDKKTRPLYPCMPLKMKNGEISAPEIHKIRLPIIMNSGVDVRGGLAGNGRMVRTDVFRDENGFWLVPVYTHQVADKINFPKPPVHACIAYKAPDEWRDMSRADFLFSLYPWSYVRLINKNGKITEGYYRGTGIRVASIVISSHEDSSRRSNLGVKTLSKFQKLHVDILGNRSLIGKESRLWHGVAYT